MGGSIGVEHGGQGEEIKEPLMGNHPNTCATNSRSSGEGESIWVVFLSTFVAICGSFEFGSCVRTYVYVIQVDQNATFFCK